MVRDAANFAHGFMLNVIQTIVTSKCIIKKELRPTIVNLGGTQKEMEKLDCDASSARRLQHPTA